MCYLTLVTYFGSIGDDILSLDLSEPTSLIISDNDYVDSNYIDVLIHHGTLRMGRPRPLDVLKTASPQMYTLYCWIFDFGLLNGFIIQPYDRPICCSE